MMSSEEIRQQFLDFFKTKGHAIVPSSPIVIKDDPTLLFTNAGMNQFKDYFLGNKVPPYQRVADTQKCLRVSGKHNDLEEVGVDTYHHTMFEMLGNWSFGDYFKKEAIAWSWELLTEVYKIPADRLYVTVFEGDAKEGLPPDDESAGYWKEHVAEDRILRFGKKDNFWEMGDTGPCGPCTEIHVDSRSDEERQRGEGKSLVNKDHPQVIEIWNNVFIQYNRKKDGSLEPLPSKHVDTGMGFERLVRVIQDKKSNYDTDVFTGTIKTIEKLSGKNYTNTGSKADVAFRVLADHVRAIAFPIADGQLPSNSGAGYVIRRVLRRAVRYYFSYLAVKEPLLYKLIPLLAQQFKNVFPEVEKQQEFIAKVVHEEEQNFLRTLEKGLSLFEEGLLKTNLRKPISDAKSSEDSNAGDATILPGKIAFELYDTFGFPLDLTKLISAERGLSVDEEGFNKEMQQQKARSRSAGAIDTGDWVTLKENGSSKFVGYAFFEADSDVLRYRKTKTQGKEAYQVVLNQTPFYAESGGQVGDTGTLSFAEEQITVTDTKKENDLIIHFTQKLPADPSAKVMARIDGDRRSLIKAHHTATHLMHAALRQVLGKHVAQKGSLVNDQHLRFDFSHFAKVTNEELSRIEALVNKKIRQNIPVVTREMNKEEALEMGAMALFGEKYGDIVRVVIIDAAYSVELCGGTHAGNTGELGLFKIKHETAVGAGVRRIEGVSGKAAEDLVNGEFELVHLLREKLKNPKDLARGIDQLLQENAELRKQLEKFEASYLASLGKELLEKAQIKDGFTFIGQVVHVSGADALKKICFALKNDLHHYVILLAAEIEGKVYTALMLDEFAAAGKKLDAVKITREIIAPLIKGGGGGQKTFATAGGQDAAGLTRAIEEVKQLL